MPRPAAPAARASGPLQVQTSSSPQRVEARLRRSTGSGDLSLGEHAAAVNRLWRFAPFTMRALQPHWRIPEIIFVVFGNVPLSEVSGTVTGASSIPVKLDREPVELRSRHASWCAAHSRRLPMSLRTFLATLLPHLRGLRLDQAFIADAGLNAIPVT